MQPSQAEKAANFRNQHHSGRLLVLPNIWDPLGARLMEKLGYPSVATASVATAMSNGYGDGEKIPFAELLKLVRRITSVITIPVTVDIERGYAGSIIQLRDNMHALIENGAVGINIEDSQPDHQDLIKLEDQCRKIEAVRETGIKLGVPVVINARADNFVIANKENAVDKAIVRAKAYKKAGADCVYPILINRYEDISKFVEAVEMPTNVNLLKPIGDLKKLEKAGVARVSAGPQLLYHVLSAMKQIGEELMQYDTASFFSRELLPREFMDSLV
jgi:2-methylisocitrate lyase-like PEP mutase family enzyme